MDEIEDDVVEVCCETTGIEEKVKAKLLEVRSFVPFIQRVRMEYQRSLSNVQGHRLASLIGLLERDNVSMNTLNKIELVVEKLKNRFEPRISGEIIEINDHAEPVARTSVIESSPRTRAQPHPASQRVKPSVAGSKPNGLPNSPSNGPKPKPIPPPAATKTKPAIPKAPEPAASPGVASVKSSGSLPSSPLNRGVLAAMQEARMEEKKQRANAQPTSSAKESIATAPPESELTRRSGPASLQFSRRLPDKPVQTDIPDFVRRSAPSVPVFSVQEACPMQSEKKADSPASISLEKARKKLATLRGGALIVPEMPPLSSNTNDPRGKKSLSTPSNINDINLNLPLLAPPLLTPPPVIRTPSPIPPPPSMRVPFSNIPLDTGLNVAASSREPSIEPRYPRIWQNKPPSHSHQQQQPQQQLSPQPTQGPSHSADPRRAPGAYSGYEEPANCWQSASNNSKNASANGNTYNKSSWSGSLKGNNGANARGFNGNQNGNGNAGGFNGSAGFRGGYRGGHSNKSRGFGNPGTRFDRPNDVPRTYGEHRKAKARAEAEAKAKAAEEERQMIADIQRQVDADEKRKALAAEKQRMREESEAAAPVPELNTSYRNVTLGPFTKKLDFRIPKKTPPAAPNSGNGEGDHLSSSSSSLTSKSCDAKKDKDTDKNTDNLENEPPVSEANSSPVSELLAPSTPDIQPGQTGSKTSNSEATPSASLEIRQREDDEDEDEDEDIFDSLKRFKKATARKRAVSTSEAKPADGKSYKDADVQVEPKKARLEGEETPAKQPVEEVTIMDTDENSSEPVIQPPPKSRTKPRKKRNELDKLNEDIAQMYYGEEVLRATGRRACTRRSRTPSQTRSVGQRSSSQRSRTPSLSRASPASPAGDSIFSVSAASPIFIRNVARRGKAFTPGSGLSRTFKKPPLMKTKRCEVKMKRCVQLDEMMRKEDEQQKPAKKGQKKKQEVRNTNSEWHAKSKATIKCVVCSKPVRRSPLCHYLLHHEEHYAARLPPGVLEELRAGRGHQPDYSILQRGISLHFTCPFCQKALLLTRQELGEHLANHMGEPRYQCSHCHFPQNRFSRLQAHTRTCGADAKPLSHPKSGRLPMEVHVCHLCQFVQQDRKNMDRHLLRQHGLTKEQLKSVDREELLLCSTEDVPSVKTTEEGNAMLRDKQEGSPKPSGSGGRVPATPMVAKKQRKHQKKIEIRFKNMAKKSVRLVKREREEREEEEEEALEAEDEQQVTKMEVDLGMAQLPQPPPEKEPVLVLNECLIDVEMDVDLDGDVDEEQAIQNKNMMVDEKPVVLRDLLADLVESSQPTVEETMPVAPLPMEEDDDEDEDVDVEQVTPPRTPSVELAARAARAVSLAELDADLLDGIGSDGSDVEIQDEPRLPVDENGDDDDDGANYDDDDDDDDALTDEWVDLETAKMAKNSKGTKGTKVTKGTKSIFQKYNRFCSRLNKATRASGKPLASNASHSSDGSKDVPDPSELMPQMRPLEPEAAESAEQTDQPVAADPAAELVEALVVPIREPLPASEPDPEPAAEPVPVPVPVLPKLRVRRFTGDRLVEPPLTEQQQQQQPETTLNPPAVEEPKSKTPNGMLRHLLAAEPRPPNQQVDLNAAEATKPAEEQPVIINYQSGLGLSISQVYSRAQMSIDPVLSPAVQDPQPEQLATPPVQEANCNKFRCMATGCSFTATKVMFVRDHMKFHSFSFRTGYLNCSYCSHVAVDVDDYLRHGVIIHDLARQ